MPWPMASTITTKLFATSSLELAVCSPRPCAHQRPLFHPFDGETSFIDASLGTREVLGATMQGPSTIQIGRYYPQRWPAASTNPILENHPSDATLQVLPTCQECPAWYGVHGTKKPDVAANGVSSSHVGALEVGEWRWTLADLSPYRRRTTHLIKEFNDRIPVFTRSYDNTPVPGELKYQEACKI